MNSFKKMRDQFKKLIDKHGRENISIACISLNQMLPVAQYILSEFVFKDWGYEVTMNTNNNVPITKESMSKTVPIIGQKVHKEYKESDDGKKIILSGYKNTSYEIHPDIKDDNKSLAILNLAKITGAIEVFFLDDGIKNIENANKIKEELQKTGCNLHTIQIPKSYIGITIEWTKQLIKEESYTQGYPGDYTALILEMIEKEINVNEKDAIEKYIKEKERLEIEEARSEMKKEGINVDEEGAIEKYIEEKKRKRLEEERKELEEEKTERLEKRRLEVKEKAKSEMIEKGINVDEEGAIEKYIEEKKRKRLEEERKELEAKRKEFLEKRNKLEEERYKKSFCGKFKKLVSSCLGCCVNGRDKGTKTIKRKKYEYKEIEQYDDMISKYEEAIRKIKKQINRSNTIGITHNYNSVSNK